MVWSRFSSILYNGLQEVLDDLKSSLVAPAKNLKLKSWSALSTEQQSKTHQSSLKNG